MSVTSRGFRDLKEGALDNLQGKHTDSRRLVVPKAVNGLAGGLGGLSASITVSAGRVLELFPPVFIYCMVIQETLRAGGKIQRVITGGADGRIKVLIPSPFLTSITHSYSHILYFICLCRCGTQAQESSAVNC